jgi:hypothetical protein
MLVLYPILEGGSEKEAGSLTGTGRNGEEGLWEVGIRQSGYP